MIPDRYKAEITKILYMMAEVLRDSVSEAMVDGWVLVLASENVTVDEARAAAVEIMKSREYNKLPTPAAFIEMVRPKEDMKFLAGQQADLVIKAIREVGGYRWPGFDDPVTAELMRSRWSWRGFCDNLLESEVKWWRREFVEAYCDLASPARKRIGTPGVENSGPPLLPYASPRESSPSGGRSVSPPPSVDHKTQAGPKQPGQTSPGGFSSPSRPGGVARLADCLPNERKGK